MYDVSRRLITISFSHFCEKARWALDRLAVSYREEPQVPIFHWAATYGAGGGHTVPVLVDKGVVLRDSTDILKHLDAQAPPWARLYPTEPAARARCEEWEDLFDARLDNDVRRIFYAALLPNRRALRELVCAAGPRWQRFLAARLMAPFRLAVRLAIGTSPKAVRLSIERVEALFEQVSATLRDNRPYLMGDRFTAADLTFAALAGPLVVPSPRPGQPVLANLSFAAPADAALQPGLRQCLAGAFVQRLYAEERARITVGAGSGPQLF